ncbi:isopenicillin N synthase family dioxygenase [Rhodococcus sovatensis]|uniref:2-oxoglutarate and iron-dependent oxygenase domain-containing protein n=1 Tax=Rhodococcus sovatensis TaxID=1805840 RepID=A0ABZ2PLL9_9NOCA
MLPIIDMSELETEAGLEVLRDVTHDVGFFYLTGHGVPPELVSDIRSVARKFFDLPDERKRAVAMMESPHFRGYNSVGGELTNGHIDWREQIDIGPEREAIAGAEGAMRLQGPNQWPADLPEFKPTVMEFQSKMFAIGLALMRKWALALGGDLAAVDRAFATAPEALLKLIKYPPRQAQSGDDGQGVGAHKDPGVLTLLLLEPGTSGLQVEDLAGSWIDAPPVEGAFVVNIGELLEVATGGFLRATRHRVVKSADFRERLSIPYFFGPALDMPMPTFELSPELAVQSRGVAQDPANLIFATYGENLWKARVRAHPEVFERWYSEAAVRSC